mmetsp:Transcript_33046/g.78142  ORF Transcript_33046/g.78142 Transcript_33046/m.78142 type:complete len:254 (+) Transcript_33046:809-1570(+)
MLGSASHSATSISAAAMRTSRSSGESARADMPSTTCASTGLKRRGCASATSARFSSASSPAPEGLFCRADSSTLSIGGSASPRLAAMALCALRTVLAALRPLSSGADSRRSSASRSLRALFISIDASAESAAVCTSVARPAVRPSSRIACTPPPHFCQLSTSTSAGAMWPSTLIAASWSVGLPEPHACCMKSFSWGQPLLARSSAPSRPTVLQSLRRSDGAWSAERALRRPVLTLSRVSSVNTRYVRSNIAGR